MSDDQLRPHRDLDSEEGFGLVEIVVAMFVLATVAIALLPLLIQGIKISAMNSTLASATQLVHDRIEQARGTATCDGLAALEGTTTTAADARGKRFAIAVDVIDACPTLFPGVQELVVTVADLDAPSETIADARTIVLVESVN